MNNKQYKIVVTGYYYDNYEHVDTTDLDYIFNSRSEAELIMYRYVVDELNDLNSNGEPGGRSFLATLEDENYDAVINCWDGEDYRKVTCYSIVEC